jgi:hypothetical protein
MIMMRQITEKQLVQVCNKLKETNSVTHKPENNNPMLTQAAIHLVNELFEDLLSIFTGYKQCIPNIEALNNMKKTWVKAFIENGINRNTQIERGKKKARASAVDFFPSVGKFITWCKVSPEDIGLPDLYKAFREASRKIRFYHDYSWSHPTVLIAALKVGGRAFSYNEKKAFEMYKKEYDIAVNRQVHGEDLSKEVPKKLPLKEIKIADPAVAARCIDKARRQLKAHRAGIRFADCENVIVGEVALQ